MDLAEIPNTITSLSEAERAVALSRFKMIQAFLEDGTSLAELAEQGGVSTRTARRWVKNYRQGGLAAIAKTRRADFGRRKSPEQLIAYIEAQALRLPRLSAASISRLAKAFADSHGLRAPGYTTVRKIIAGLGSPLRHLAYEGKKSFSNKYDLIYRREASEPNEIWQADHTQLDILVLDPEGKSVRPWLTAIIDDHSRAVCGYLIGLDAPCAINTALTLHQAIWRKAEPNWHVCGIPQRFYTDHGSDFTSQHMEQVTADIKTQLIFSTVGQPRGRGKLERFFGTVNQQFLCTLPGYTAGGGQPQAALSVAEVDALFRTWLLNDYMMRAHGETLELPQRLWDKTGFVPRMPESLEQLDLLLLTVAEPRIVHPDGIHFQRLRYIAGTLAAYVGEKVVIRFDPRDIAQIRVFHNTRFLCVATCTALSGSTVSLKEIIKARKEQCAKLAKELKEKRSLIDEYVSMHHAPEGPLPIDDRQNKPQSSTLKSYESD